MKNFIIVLLITATVFVVNVFSVARFFPQSKNVTISTTTIVIANELVNRKYFLAINKSTTYNIKISSSSNLKPSDHLGIPLNKALDGQDAGGWYEDAYFVYISTWYACVDNTTGTAVINITEKE